MIPAIIIRAWTLIAIDYQLRGSRFHRSQHDDFTQAMKADADDLKNLSGFGRKSKKQAAIKQGLADAYEQARQELLDASDRKDLLRHRFAELGLELEQVEAALERHTVINELKGIGRDGRYMQLAVAIRERDAKGLLNILESLDPDGSSTSAMAWTLRNKTYHKGIEGKLSDLFSAATRTKIEGSGGHSLSYYRDRTMFGGQQTEAFANLTALYGDRSPFWAHIVERFTPRMAERYKEIINGI